MKEDTYEARNERIPYFENIPYHIVGKFWQDKIWYICPKLFWVGLKFGAFVVTLSTNMFRVWPSAATAIYIEGRQQGNYCLLPY